jgi:hypothetical protein
VDEEGGEIKSRLEVIKGCLIYVMTVKIKLGRITAQL